MMFENVLNRFFGKSIAKPDTSEDIFVMPASNMPHKDYLKITDAKRFRYAGVQIVFHGIPGKAAPEDQADRFEKDYLQPNGFRVVKSDYQRSRSILTIQF